MKKYIIIFIMLLLLTTGCSNINNLSYDELVNEVFSEKVIKANTSFKGYKFYLPKNMTLLNDLDDNNVLYCNGNKYFLYVDLVSYYNKVRNEYKVNENKEVVYSKIINEDNNYGYILVTEFNGEYFVEVMYNYAKVEVISDNIKESVLNSLIVLRSITYNDNIIEILQGKSIDYNEEKFQLLGPSVDTEQYLKYVEEYGTYEEDIVDDKKIEIDSEN